MLWRCLLWVYVYGYKIRVLLTKLVLNAIVAANVHEVLCETLDRMKQWPAARTVHPENSDFAVMILLTAAASRKWSMMTMSLPADIRCVFQLLTLIPTTMPITANRKHQSVKVWKFYKIKQSFVILSFNLV